jgi:hypothetical protein
MKIETKTRELHGWDDEKIYFWDKEESREWCVSDEEELYNQLVEICREYFKKKVRKGDKVK